MTTSDTAGLQIRWVSVDVSRSPSAKEVSDVRRNWTILGDKMKFKLDMAAVGQELQTHLIATLLKKQLQVDAKFLGESTHIIDVREDSEFVAGNIPGIPFCCEFTLGGSISIPMGEFLRDFDKEGYNSKIDNVRNSQVSC
jgi:hypothetical protein